MVFQTPSGDVIKDSSDYHDGHYILLLPNPIKGGNYTCEVPKLYADEACLAADSPHETKASVTVDGVCHCLYLHVQIYHVSLLISMLVGCLTNSYLVLPGMLCGSLAFG